MANGNKSKVKPPMEKGDKRCYKTESIAKRVEGGMKAKKKRVTRTGRCIEMK